MNYKQKLLRKREVLNLIRFSNRSGSHTQCIRLNCNNTWEHELKKFEICWKLLKEKKEFLTEAIFLNGKRADIIDLSGEGKVIEVLHSESFESFKEKIKNYPLEAEYVKTKEE